MMRIVSIGAMALAVLGGFCAVLTMIAIVTDVMMRWLFHAPLPGITELVTHYLLVPLAFLPLAAIQEEDRHIAVELFFQLLSARWQRACALLTTLLATAVTALVVWYSTREALHGYRLGEVVESGTGVLTVWPSRFLLLLGIAGMLLVLILQVFQRLAALFGHTSAKD